MLFPQLADVVVEQVVADQRLVRVRVGRQNCRAWSPDSPWHSHGLDRTPMAYRRHLAPVSIEKARVRQSPLGDPKCRTYGRGRLGGVQARSHPRTRGWLRPTVT
jgi:hypothetical protein